MAFLYPAFLVGALAIALPIALHLLRRDVAPEVRFSAVRLLKRSPVERSRRRRLRDLLLLAARVTALLLLATAFARPFAPGAASAMLPLRIVAVDRSYSMAAPGVFERAREMFLERGLKWPWDEEEQQADPDPEHQSIEEAIVEHEQDVDEAKATGEEEKKPEYVPPPTTTRIDVTAVVNEKMESARQHRTQFDPQGLFMTTPDDIVPVMFGEEHYSLVKSLVDGPVEETDMLAGLD